VTFWRKEVIEFALDQETLKHIEEQRAWIAQEPANPQPYCNLARLYRISGKPDEALGLLLEAVRLDSSFAEAHASLAEVYSVRGDHRAAWRHARAAEASGEPRAVELLTRYGVLE
jgi:thioredoxin-like negative regulator of GroEL